MSEVRFIKFTLFYEGPRTVDKTFNTQEELAEAANELLLDGEVEDGVLDYLTNFDPDRAEDGCVEKSFNGIVTRAFLAA